MTVSEHVRTVSNDSFSIAFAGQDFVLVNESGYSILLWNSLYLVHNGQSMSWLYRELGSDAKKYSDNLSIVTAELFDMPSNGP